MPKIALSRSAVKITLFLSAVAIAAAFLAVNLLSNQKTTSANFDFANSDFKTFENFTKANGVEASYKLLKQKFPNNETSAHNLAHIIGLSTFSEKGVGGLGVCDTAFNYGCYHGFIEAFLQKMGVSQVSQIEKACNALGLVSAPSCLHGIGHGVMSLSYNLDKALKDCEALSQGSRLYCFDGVFMERATGSMQNPKDRFVMTADNLMEPCASLDKIYQRQCWRNQVFAWWGFFAGDISKISLQCQAVGNELVDECYRNLGISVAMSSQAADAAVSTCKKILLAHAFDLCLLGSMDELMFEGRDPDLVQTICVKVSLAAKNMCEENFATLKGDFKTRFGK